MPNTIKGSLVIILSTAVVLAANASPAAAEGPDSVKIKAKGQLEEGARLFERGEYEGALSRFKAAYDLYPSAKIQFNFGQAYRALGRNDDAVAAFKRFLDEAKDASISLRDEAQQYIRELQPAIGPGNKMLPPVPSPPAPAGQSSGSPARPDLHAPDRSLPPTSNEALISGSSSSEKAKADDRQSGQTRWWLWGAGGVVVAGVVTALILGRDTKNPDCLGIAPCGSVR